MSTPYFLSQYEVLGEGTVLAPQCIALVIGDLGVAHLELANLDRLQIKAVGDDARHYAGGAAASGNCSGKAEQTAPGYRCLSP
ncbi:hypothetical protein D3C81_2045680 [compost metagenome]